MPEWSHPFCKKHWFSRALAGCKGLWQSMHLADLIYNSDPQDQKTKCRQNPRLNSIFSTCFPNNHSHQVTLFVCSSVISHLITLGWRSKITDQHTLVVHNESLTKKTKHFHTKWTRENAPSSHRQHKPRCCVWSSWMNTFSYKNVVRYGLH